MYLKSIVIENSGPIEMLNIELPLNEKNKPKPLIFVGENGKGKSTLLSSVVDALFEFAKQPFNDIVDINPNGTTPYYKVMSNRNIRVGNKFSFTFLEFIDEDKQLQYIEKIGELSFETCKEKTGNKLQLHREWMDNGNVKNVSQEEDYFKGEFENNSICFFPPNRHEKPSWMNTRIVYNTKLNIQSRLVGMLNKPLIVQDVTNSNLGWLLDIVVDSRTDIFQDSEGKWHTEGNLNNMKLLKIARENVEEILSEILGKKVKFGLNWRNLADMRFNILDRETNEIIIPTLDALSTGELALFNMFSTIIRYADYGDINRSIKLEEIKGIVIIDEIDLHTHSIIQREVLPKLINKFPEVQFICTSHSPLFILGMEEVFGKDGFNIYNMPSGEIISSEEFSEFESSYMYYKNTVKFRKQMQLEIGQRVGKTLIVTEGPTDWKHMKRALQQLQQSNNYSEAYQMIDVEFLEYEDRNSQEGDFKLDMGDGTLVEMCKYNAKLKQVRKIIFIGDRDTRKSDELSAPNCKYKYWGNNIYSFQIPLPEHRKDTPLISIEHYYTDTEIKTVEVFEDGTKRRLYMGNDFNSNGICIEEQIMCEKRKVCGQDKINIIEGSNGEKIIPIDDSLTTNYAISKNRFIENIIAEKEGFKDIRYENFRLIFDIIKEIEDIQ